MRSLRGPDGYWRSEWEACLEDPDFDFDTPGLVFLRLAKIRLSDSSFLTLDVATNHDGPPRNSADAPSIGLKAPSGGETENVMNNGAAPMGGSHGCLGFDFEKP